MKVEYRRYDRPNTDDDDEKTLRYKLLLSPMVRQWSLEWLAVRYLNWLTERRATK